MAENDEKENTPNDIETSVNSEVEELKKALEKAKTDHLYLLAEFDNYRKNAIKERADLVKYGHERLSRDLIAVLDNFERALALDVNAENYAQFVSGIKMTAQELKSLLQKNGIEEIPSQDQPFNPVHHEALSSEPTDRLEPGMITQVFRKPYKIHDRILRPGQVVVASEPIKKEQ